MILIFLILLLIALGILFVPFVKNKTLSKKHFIFTSLFVVLFSVGLYAFTTDFSALNEWNTHGQQRYQLLTEYQQLGGLDGMISKINEKLKNNPNDSQGWFILGKLYLMKKEYGHAKTALEKAHHLDPNNGQIEYFYQISQKQ